MWFLNKKTILLDLPKLTYKCWEEVNWVIKFNFGEEKIKADKITIWLNREISSNSMDISNWVNRSTNKRYDFLLETNLMWKWEYTKEEIPFKFVIPFNAIQDDISFDKILNKIPKTFRSIAEILIVMIVPNMRKRYTFSIIARIDIPWAIDITEKVAINIINDEKNITDNSISNKIENNEEKNTDDFIIK